MQRRQVVIPLTLILVALLLAACGGSANEPEAPSAPRTYTTLGVQDAFQRLEANDEALIVDVRNPEEWAATGIPVGAELISLPEFEARAPQELPKDREIVVICNSGNRSRVASEALIRLGYANVVNVDGGIQDWLRAGLPVEPYTP